LSNKNESTTVTKKPKFCELNKAKKGHRAHAGTVNLGGGRACVRGSRLPHARPRLTRPPRARASACCLLCCGQWSTTTTVPYQEGFKTSALDPPWACASTLRGPACQPGACRYFRAINNDRRSCECPRLDPFTICLVAKIFWF